MIDSAIAKCQKFTGVQLRNQFVGSLRPLAVTHCGSARTPYSVTGVYFSKHTFCLKLRTPLLNG